MASESRKNKVGKFAHMNLKVDKTMEAINFCIKLMTPLVLILAAGGVLVIIGYGIMKLLPSSEETLKHKVEKETRKEESSEEHEEGSNDIWFYVLVASVIGNLLMIPLILST